MEETLCTVGLKVKAGDKVRYYVEPEATKLQLNDLVVVKGEHGMEVARVVSPSRQVSNAPDEEDLPSVLHRATKEELKQKTVSEEEALLKCREYARELGLPMKPTFASSNIDGSYIVVYFVSPHKVDFRELAYRINSDLRTRVELRRVGTREGARLLGGMGRCGLPICCSSFLSELSPPTTKAVKRAGLNPSKFCGLCGHILCCLAYDDLKDNHVSEE
jgi:cell fate regulator YaaT (PSP1 superfamily)